MATERSVRKALRPEDRLRRRAEYLAAQSKGQRLHTRHFLIVVHARELGGRARLGVTVTKKVSSAVGRNRVKRVVREVFRNNPDLFPRGCDVVLIAKAGADSLGYGDVLTETRAVARAMNAAARRSFSGLDPHLDRPERQR